MELANGKNSFDPTPKLKSSPVPISFVSFNYYEINCFGCGEEYTETPFCYFGYRNGHHCQKYCKKCLSSYLTNITDDNISIYLDAYYGISCSKHEISVTKELQNIQECCKDCLEILCFKQLPADYFYCSDSSYYNVCENVIESEKNCKLCGKLLYQGTDEYTKRQFKLCSDCYLISSENIESTLTKKPVQIIYLPWWHNIDWCSACDVKLTFTSDCQKYCANCCIFYAGCRFCLTTNVIFGFTNYSQCKKCKKVLSVIFNNNTNIFSGNSDLDDFLTNLIPRRQLKVSEFADNIKNNDKYFNPLEICNTIYRGHKRIEPANVKWIPYSQFTNIKRVAEGGYGIIYQATWISVGSIKTVILKRFKNLRDSNRYFLNELKSNQHCYKHTGRIIETYGFTKDPNLDNYIIVMQYASGDLHKYLQRNFTKIQWNKQKIFSLWQISFGLETIHSADFIHRDFHSGNILLLKDLFETIPKLQWQIGDLGLSQHVNDASPSNEIYGVIPYIAPEIFKGSSFSKESDVYSMGMIMWELTTGCKPFANVEHNIQLVYKILDGERPEITEDTPDCYADLMKSCWDPDPKKRPSIVEIRETFSKWSRIAFDDTFNKAELKRKELIKSKKLGPEFAKISHPKAIYTSRPLSSFISKFSSRLSSKELEFDIDIRRSKTLAIKRNIEDKTIDETNIEWIPYSQITDLKEIATGGFGVVYKALNNGKVVAIKKLLNYQSSSKNFLNELKSLYKCYDNNFEYIIKCHGITIDFITREPMFIMKYANGGDLHRYLQNNFTNITWRRKLYILWRISDGLQTIHEKDFIHRDFHSGNVLVEIIDNIDQYLIGDLGLSQPANNTSSSVTYGVIPYVAPEIFKGAKYSKESDVYSMGMVMWELTTGCKPFCNVEHDIELIYKIFDGKRPEITNDTLEDFTNLMKKCWNPNPEKRPTAKEICKRFNLWSNKENDIMWQFDIAEEIRLELVKSKILGPNLNEKPHPKAIYTSRPLNSLISKCSSANSSSMTSFNTEPKYISKEYELDINNTIQRPNILDSNTQDHLTNQEYTSTEYELDINDTYPKNASM